MARVANPDLVAARAAGLKRYFCSRPCPYGHVGERQVTNDKCLVCRDLDKQDPEKRARKQASTKRWRKKNPEKRLAQVLRSARKHPEKKRARENSYYQRHRLEIRARQNSRYDPEKEHERKQKYAAENPDRYREVTTNAARNRRARIVSAEGSHTPEDIRWLENTQKMRCACCSTKLSQGYHIDHIVPLARGGSNDRRNLQLLCPPCNLSKSHKDPIEWAQSKGRLL